METEAGYPESEGARAGGESRIEPVSEHWASEEAARFLRDGFSEAASEPLGERTEGEVSGGGEVGAGEIEYADLIPRLRALGATPELVREVLEAYEQQAALPSEPPEGLGLGSSVPMAEMRFEDWVEQQGLRWSDCSPAERVALHSAFQHDQRLRAFEWEARAAQQHMLAARWGSELQATREAYPEFSDPELSRDLLARWAEMPDGVTISQVAETMRRRWMTAFRNQLASQAAEQSQAARRPVMRGGGLPSVSEAPDVKRMSDDDFEQFIRSELEAWDRSGR